MSFHAAAPSEFAAVRRLYDEIIDGMAGSPFEPKWEKGIYPSDELLKTELSKGTVHISDALNAVAILNTECPAEYANGAWQAFEKGEVLYIHALGVRPDCHRAGIARGLIAYLLDVARAQGCKAVRLDVLPHNKPAQSLYRACGFIQRPDLHVFYQSTGLTVFHIFEYLL